MQPKHYAQIWNDIRRTATDYHDINAFPVALPYRLIQNYTSREQKVIFDPFCGTGATLIAAKQHRKDCIGIDISSTFSDIARERTSYVNTWGNSVEIWTHDSRRIKYVMKPEIVDLVVTAPPYWGVETDTHIEGDIGDIPFYMEYLDTCQCIFRQVKKVMKPDTYCCVVVRDTYSGKKGDRFPFTAVHANFITRLSYIGLQLVDIILWDRSKESKNKFAWNLSFKERNPQKQYEYILVFYKDPNDQTWEHQDWLEKVNRKMEAKMGEPN